jgi:hypothetical protein
MGHTKNYFLKQSRDEIFFPKTNNIFCYNIDVHMGGRGMEVGGGCPIYPPNNVCEIFCYYKIKKNIKLRDLIFKPQVPPSKVYAKKSHGLITWSFNYCASMSYVLKNI